jgi:hypothetical protein
MKPRSMKFYVLDGKTPVPVPNVLKWSKWFSNANRIVKQYRIEDVGISTVFMWFDHRWFGDGPPLLFETMVFGGSRDGQMYRYSSWDDAEIGHEMEVKRVHQALVEAK